MYIIIIINYPRPYFARLFYGHMQVLGDCWAFFFQSLYPGVFFGFKEGKPGSSPLHEVSGQLEPSLMSLRWSRAFRKSLLGMLCLGYWLCTGVLDTFTIWQRFTQRALPTLVLGFQSGLQMAIADEGDSASDASGFNIFLLIVPLAVIALLRWVFSLKPKQDETNEGYLATTLRGRDSEEKLQERIKEMEERWRLEELRTKKLLEAAAKGENFEDESLDEDLFSSDLKAQLKAAQE